MSLLSRLKSVVLDLIFPLHCVACASEGAILCAPCRAKLQFIAPSCFVCKKLVPAREKALPGKTCAPCRAKTHVYAFFSPFSYGSATVKNLVHDLKYRSMRVVAPVLGDLIADYLSYERISLPHDALIIPIPLHKARERMRGFNQSYLIARPIGERLNIPVLKDILIKIKKTTPQMELTREERLQNALGTFSVSDRSRVLIADKTIIILDDVKTTGATLEEAARVLRAAGAKRILAITLAH